ncbi:MAG: chromosomal replication initiator DnaA [Pseudomonadota bacterium]
MPEQLAFDLPVRPALGRDAFFVSPANAAALGAIDAWMEWPAGRQLLVGPAGSGKSHLAHVWEAMTGARILAASRLAIGDVPGLVRNPAVVLEDIDRGVNEDAFFHLLNLAQVEGTALLLSARQPPSSWKLGLPDLSSRIATIPLTRLKGPDDQLLAAVLVKLFSDRQLSVDARLIGFLVPRIERSFEAAREIVTLLDEQALERGRSLNRNFAAEILDKRKGCHA